MPPRRPLPDLCLIAVMKMLTPNDQLKAAQMSPRSAVLVRAANRRVKMLVITRSKDFGWIENRINRHSLASIPSMQLLPAGGEPFPDYPMTTTRISKWNCLQMDKNQHFDQSTVEQIVNTFSAVNDLKLDMSRKVDRENLIALLERPEWTNQLTSLACFGVFNGVDMNLPTEPRLIFAINALSALQCLFMGYNGNHQQPELSILAQLKMAVIFSGTSAKGFFQRSLERHAAGNVDLKVFLIGYDYSELFGFSEPARRRIFRSNNFRISVDSDDVSTLCRQLPFLISHSVGCKEARQLEALFTALSTLPQLVHLDMVLFLKRQEGNQFEEPTPPPPPRPLAQLTALRVLELNLSLRSHEQMQWLKRLPVTMPRLQAIHLRAFSCASCGVNLYKYLEGEYSETTNPSTSTALKCFSATLPLLHPGIPQDRIGLGYSPNEQNPHSTLKELMSTSE